MSVEVEFPLRLGNCDRHAVRPTDRPTDGHMVSALESFTSNKLQGLGKSPVTLRLIVPASQCGSIIGKEAGF